MATASNMSLKERVGELVRANYPLVNQCGLQDSDSFLENGAIDSLGMIELVALLNKEFGVVVTDDELMPENLDSINEIAEFLARKGAKD